MGSSDECSVTAESLRLQIVRVVGAGSELFVVRQEDEFRLLHQPRG